MFELDVWDVWPILRKHRRIIVLFFATVVVATAIGVAVTEREYRATTVLHILPKVSQELQINEVVDNTQRGHVEINQFFRTQVEIMRSRTVREEVAKRYDALGRLLPDGSPDRLAVRGDGTVDYALGAGRVGGMLLVVPVEQSQLFTLNITDTVPERAAIIANLLADVYMERNLDLRREAAREAKKWLKTESDHYKQRIEEANHKLLAYKSANDLIDVEEHLTSMSARMLTLNQTYAEVSTKRLGRETSLANHERLLAKGDLSELVKILNNPLLNNLQIDLQRAKQEESDLATTYAEKHPLRRTVADRVAQIEGEIRRDVEKSIASERNELALAIEDEANLKREIDLIKQELLVVQRQRTEYYALKDELELNQKFYEKLTQRLDEVHLSSRTQLNNVYVIDPAVVPQAAVRPQVTISMLIAAVVGLVGGVMLALLREYVDDTVRSHVDVATYLKVPYVGLVPSLPPGITGREADLYTHFNPRSSVAEAVRGLRALLDLNPNGEAPKRLLITSSVAREGKTSTVTRLAVAYAQSGRRVVVIDADLRKPRQHKVYGFTNDIGLGNALLGVATVEQVIRPTEVPNLSVVCAGAGTEHPAELLASPAMEVFLRRLDELFDVILIDTPPSVALADAVSVSHLVDGVLLIVREQSVSRHVAKRTVELFQQVNAPLIGVVLNNVSLEHGGVNYKYYYAYRDYYTNYEPRPPDKGMAAK